MKRRGISLIEILVAMSVMVFVCYTAIGLTRTTFTSWNKTNAENEAKEAISRAVIRMEPDIRAALHVDTTSNDKVLTLLMPKKEAGEIVVPLEDGNSVSFYLSDRSGREAGTGPILWRAVNGIPDKSWSLRSNHGAIDLGSSAEGMRFAYTEGEEPLGVHLQVQVNHGSGASTIVRKGAGAGYLRNCPKAEDEATEDIS